MEERKPVVTIRKVRITKEIAKAQLVLLGAILVADHSGEELHRLRDLAAYILTFEMDDISKPLSDIIEKAIEILKARDRDY